MFENKLHEGLLKKFEQKNDREKSSAGIAEENRIKKMIRKTFRRATIQFWITNC